MLFDFFFFFWFFLKWNAFSDMDFSQFRKLDCDTRFMRQICVFWKVETNLIYFLHNIRSNIALNATLCVSQNRFVTANDELCLERLILKSISKKKIDLHQSSEYSKKTFHWNNFIQNFLYTRLSNQK